MTNLILAEDKLFYSDRLKNLYDELETLSREEKHLKIQNQDYNFLRLKNIDFKKDGLKIKIEEYLDKIF